MLSLEADRSHAVTPPGADTASPLATPSFHVIRRNRSVSPFDATKIAVAMTKAFLAVEGTSAATSPRVREIVESLCAQVVSALTRRIDAQSALHI